MRVRVFASLHTEPTRFVWLMDTGLHTLFTLTHTHLSGQKRIERELCDWEPMAEMCMNRRIWALPFEHLQITRID